MIRTLRAYFLSRLLREKLLLVGFAALGLLWWASAFSTRLGAFNLQRRRTTATLLEQQQWIDNRASIEASAKKSADRLDSAKTLDGLHLNSAVQALAGDAGLKNIRQSPAPDTISGQFSFHTINYTITGIEGQAGWKALTKFYVTLRDKAPYIGIDQFSIAVAQGNSTQHSATLRVSSMEVAR